MDVRSANQVPTRRQRQRSDNREEHIPFLSDVNVTGRRWDGGFLKEEQDGWNRMFRREASETGTNEEIIEASPVQAS